jgi:hypothetical protein
MIGICGSGGSEEARLSHITTIFADLSGLETSGLKPVDEYSRTNGLLRSAHPRTADQELSHGITDRGGIL